MPVQGVSALFRQVILAESKMTFRSWGLGDDLESGYEFPIYDLADCMSYIVFRWWRLGEGGRGGGDFGLWSEF